MNKLELFLEDLVLDAEIKLSDRRLVFETKDLVLLFQRNMNSIICWLDCSWIEPDGTKNPNSYLRFDFPVRTIQNFLMKYTHSTLENKHGLIHSKSVPNNTASVVFPVYEAFIKEINESKYPLYKLSILKNKIEKSIPEKDIETVRKNKL